jgi:ABC-type taurine transport system ATPase subunit
MGSGGASLFENADGQSKAAFQLKMKQDEDALRKRFAEQVLKKLGLDNGNKRFLFD